MDSTLNAAEAGGRELIAFCAGGQEFCVDIMAVRELRGWTPTTPLPQAPEYVRGVLNLRGTVLPVIDMAVRLGLDLCEPSARHVVIVVCIGERLVGLLVDSVCDILPVTDEAMQPTPDVAGDGVANFVSALISVDDRMIGLLALDQLLPALAQAA